MKDLHPREENLLSTFIRKMEHGARLNDSDKDELREAVVRTKQLDPRQDIIQEGDAPDDVHLILEGFACRYNLLPDGRRSIMALLLPGDFCDLHVSILGEMDHNIGTLSACTAGAIPRKTVQDLTEKHPRITQALWWATLVDEGVLREWLVGMGKRAADQRAAHLFCELLVRLKAVGLGEENGYAFPLTQTDLGDIFGLSTVHINRTIQSLRDAGLISWRGKHVTIPDIDRLINFAQFNPNYLHLDDKRAERGSDWIARMQ